jgi:hypothetical protein
MATKGQYYLTKEEAQQAKEYYRIHGEFPPGVTKDQRRYLRKKLGVTYVPIYISRKLEIPGLETYTGKPCVYVRWLEPEMMFYVGMSIDLYSRYDRHALSEIIYFEEYETEEEIIQREKRLIMEFALYNLPLANRKIGGHDLNLVLEEYGLRNFLGA